jgi:hypothetical protein
MQDSIRSPREAKGNSELSESPLARCSPRRDGDFDSARPQESGLCAYTDLPRGRSESRSRSVRVDARASRGAKLIIDEAPARQKTRDAYWEWNLLQ